MTMEQLQEKMRNLKKQEQQMQKEITNINKDYNQYLIQMNNRTNDYNNSIQNKRKQLTKEINPIHHSSQTHLCHLSDYYNNLLSYRDEVEHRDEKVESPMKEWNDRKCECNEKLFEDGSAMKMNKTNKLKMNQKSLEALKKKRD